LKGWFDRHRFQPVTSALFLADLRQNLIKDDKPLEQKLGLDRWVYAPGIPPNVVRPDPKAFAEADSAVRAFEGGSAPDTSRWDRWTTDERLRFLNKLPRKLPKARLDALNAAFKLNDTRNNEVEFAWLDLAVSSHYDPAVPALEHFLTSQGRRKFVTPLVTSLSKSDWGRPIAVRIYRVARASYHPMTQRALDKLNLTS
jgi:leukotriene-A4 hydrolase